MKKKLSQNSLHTTNTSKSKAQKKWLKAAPLVMCGMMGAMFFGESSASAHGYIQDGRADRGKFEMGTIGWAAANEKYGSALNEPQSIEALKGFPMAGPVDGKIASGGIPGFAPLDVQTPLQWIKKDMSIGKNTLTWTITAEHKTTKFAYYITKQGWDKTKSLSRDMLEPIGEYDGKGQLPGKTVSHVVDIPADRNGYHVILGVWDIDDTVNAFYQAMDVNIKNDGGEVGDDTEAPTIPANLQATPEATKVNLKWTASTDNVSVDHYNVYRDGKKLAPVTGTELEDVNLQPTTAYTYEVAAVDGAGNESEKSALITVETKELPAVDTEAPTEPKGLHSMGETENTVDLMWTAATDNVGVDYYEIYRNGERVHVNVSGTRMIDKGLQSDTAYMYEVKAVDAAGNLSEKSNTLNVKTKEKAPEGTTTWETNTVYNAGDRVLFNGNEYEAKYWTQGNQPDTSNAWELISDVAVEWNAEKAYQGGEKVQHEGITYKAKWWTKGDVPRKVSVWEKQ